MNKKIKILYFMDGIGNAGGIQEMVIKWMENIDKEKFQIDILSYDTGKKDNYPERIKKLGGNVYIIPTYTKKGQLIKSLKSTKEFFEKNKDYDIIHAHASSKALFIMYYAKKLGIKSRILHSHCTQFVMTKKIALLIANLFKVPTNMLTTDYFACSPEAGEFLFGNNYVKNGSVYIAHNGINTDEFYYRSDIRNRIRKELGLQDKIIIGNVGRFRPQKNHNYLIEIFSEVYKKDNSAVLLLVGNGELEDQIREKVHYLGLEKSVYFLGFRKDVSDLMQAMDILVMPSLFEGLPVTGVEAQAEGLPCIFADTITRDAAIIPQSCYMRLEDSPEKWAEKILEVAYNYNRIDSLEFIRKKGYDIKLETQKMEEFYSVCLKNRG